VGPRIILATCRKRPQLTPSDARLSVELERLGARVTAVPWDLVAADAPNLPLVCLRSTWDYHLRAPEFRDWVTSVGASPGGLWNPPGTVLWNMDKAYLRDVASAGVAIPHSRWLSPGERPDIDAFLDETGASRAVVKPRISATAFGTHLVGPGARLGDDDWLPLESCGCLLQEFVPEVQAGGEVSLVFVAGRFTHAVRKRPSPGDFRVQAEYGGTAEPIWANAALRAFGESALAAVPRAALYARIDAIETERGPVLMELELIEPELYLGESMLAARLLARELVAKAGAAAG
jgi:glutathione synthase/RimK-type ligase-like ATP-grasp enzyme